MRERPELSCDPSAFDRAGVWSSQKGRPTLTKVVQPREQPGPVLGHGCHAASVSLKVSGPQALSSGQMHVHVEWTIYCVAQGPRDGMLPPPPLLPASNLGPYRMID